MDCKNVKKMYKAKKRWLISGGLIITASAFSFFGPVINENSININVAHAAVINTEILSSLQTTSNRGMLTDPLDGSKQNNVDFTIKGSKLIGVSAVNMSTKTGALIVPDALKNKVIPNGEANITTTVSIDPNNIPLLPAVLTDTEAILTAITKIADNTVGGLTGVSINTQDVISKLNLVKQLLNTGTGNFKAEAQISNDGKYIYIDMNDGIGQIMAQNLTSALISLQNAINTLNASGSGLLSSSLAGTINLVINPLKATANTVINTALEGLKPTGDLISKIANASVLGSTTIIIPTTINSVDKIDNPYTFVGEVVNTNVIDVNLFKESSSATNIYFKSLPKPTQPTANVSGNSTQGYTVTGEAPTGKVNLPKTDFEKQNLLGYIGSIILIFMISLFGLLKYKSDDKKND